MTKPATTLYGDKDFYDSYRDHVKSKLGMSLSARLFELARQDDASLTGKPVISSDETITRLSQRLESLMKRRDEVRKILREHRVLEYLENEAGARQGLTWTPPEREKQTIVAMLTAFKHDELDVEEDDLTLFLGLIELGIERQQILHRLHDLRLTAYNASL